MDTAFSNKVKIVFKQQLHSIIQPDRLYRNNAVKYIFTVLTNNKSRYLEIEIFLFLKNKIFIVSFVLFIIHFQ
jgi:hypothetical protein